MLSLEDGEQGKCASFHHFSTVLETVATTTGKEKTRCSDMKGVKSCLLKDEMLADDKVSRQKINVQILVVFLCINNLKMRLKKFHPQ